MHSVQVPGLLSKLICKGHKYPKADSEWTRPTSRVNIAWRLLLAIVMFVQLQCM